ncbi:MAG: RHS repeat-associated core domain-containing protein [Bacteroidia bacterium]|nr:RHS repeat-associated core domain-containing protein [Bacteroidia bacterium]
MKVPFAVAAVPVAWALSDAVIDALWKEKVVNVPVPSSQKTLAQDTTADSLILGVKFFIKDHLGNVRVTYVPVIYDTLHTCSLAYEMKSVMDYYPFGKHLRAWFAGDEERWQTTLNERDGESGLDWRGARMYDAEYGRFLQIDPIASNNILWSGYNYVNGNPIIWTDPFGLADGGDKVALWKDENGDLHSYQPTVKIRARAAKKKQGQLNYLLTAAINSYNGEGYFANEAAVRQQILDNIRYSPREMEAATEVMADVLGSSEIPGVSQVGDLLAAGLAIHQGENLNAGLSAASALPAVGVYFNVAKWFKRVINWFGFGKEVAKLVPAKAVEVVAEEGYSSFNAFKKAFGPAGQGNAWHHIVEQHSDNIAKFGAENIHNANNLIKLPHGAGTIHAKVTGHYNSLMPGTSMRVRDYVKTLSYEEQFQYGIEVLKRFGGSP